MYHCNILDNDCIGAEVHDMSLHPAHVTRPSGALTAAALIPFCAYQTKLLGERVPDLPFIPCDQFKPTVLGGQLCYSLNSSLLSTTKAKDGKSNGLLLIVDTHRYLDENIKDLEIADDNTILTLNMESSSSNKGFAKIHLNTLASFQDSRAGSYAMSALKKITATKDFLSLEEDDKGCKSETFEECHAARYIEEVKKQCGCVPWAVSGANMQKVK